MPARRLDRDVLRRLPGPRKHALEHYPAAAASDNLRRVLDVRLADAAEDGGVAQLVPRHRLFVVLCTSPARER